MQDTQKAPKPQQSLSFSVVGLQKFGLRCRASSSRVVIGGFSSRADYHSSGTESRDRNGWLYKILDDLHLATETVILRGVYDEPLDHSRNAKVPDDLLDIQFATGLK